MEEQNNKKGFFERLKAGLAKTRKLLMTDVDDILLGSKEIDQALFDELEEALILADRTLLRVYSLLKRYTPIDDRLVSKILKRLGG